MTDGANIREPVDLQDANAIVDRLMVRDVLAQLSAGHRAVLWRSYYLGWTVVRIAENLQIAEGTVKSRLHCAVRALRRTLQEMGAARWPRPAPRNRPAGREPDGG